MKSSRQWAVGSEQSKTPIKEDELHFKNPREAGRQERERLGREVHPPNCFCGMPFRHDGEHHPQDNSSLEVKAFGIEGTLATQSKVFLKGRIPLSFGEPPARVTSWYHHPDLMTHIGDAVEVRYSPTDNSCCWVIIGDRIIEALRCLETDRTYGRPSSQREVITQRQWVELSRRLLEKSRGGFSSEEAQAVNSFINYVAADVEAVQQENAK